MILFIDSSDYENTRLAVIGKNIVEHNFAGKNLSEQLLPQIEKFLKKQKTTLKQIITLAVVIGPGGFSRIRTAVSTTNSLGYALNIPIIGLLKDQVPSDLFKLGKFRGKKSTLPKYDREPNITLSQKR